MSGPTTQTRPLIGRTTIHQPFAVDVGKLSTGEAPETPKIPCDGNPRQNDDNCLSHTKELKFRSLHERLNIQSIRFE